MVTAESVKAKLQGLINLANTVTGNADTDLTAAVNALIAGFGQGGGGEVKVTEYAVTENADRSLWLNDQQIRLVKGVNLLVSSKFNVTTANVPLAQGAITLIWMIWDGVADNCTTANGATFSQKRHLVAMCHCQSTYGFNGGSPMLVAGYTTAVDVADDGLITCTTSATGVTTGNYNNSYIEGGYTYRLVQIPVEEVIR